MNTTYSPHNAYKQQDIKSARPEVLTLKLYDAALRCCEREDRGKLRKILKELIGSINPEPNEKLAICLRAMFESCMLQSVAGDLKEIKETILPLRNEWEESVVNRSPKTKQSAPSLSGAYA